MAPSNVDAATIFTVSSSKLDALDNQLPGVYDQITCLSFVPFGISPLSPPEEKLGKDDEVEVVRPGRCDSSCQTEVSMPVNLPLENEEDDEPDVRPPKYLTVVDTLWAFFVCFPILCSYWRGSWDLLGYYILPGYEPLNYWVMTAVGATYVGTFWFLPQIERYLHSSGTSRVKYVIISRALLMYQGLLFMFLWRGVWGLAEYYLGTELTHAWIWMAFTLVLLMLLGVLRSTLWPPYFVCVDTRKDLLKPIARFGSQPEDGIKYVADATFTAIVVIPAAIIVWKSAFDVMHHLVYPDDLVMSGWVCFLFGSAGTLLLFALQNPIGNVSKWLEATEHHHLKIIYEDIIYLIVYLFMTPLWRGLWELNLHYMIHDPLMGGWMHHILGTIGLLATQTFSFVGVWGCITDGENTGRGAFFPQHYFREFYKDYHSKPKNKDRAGLSVSDMFTGRKPTISAGKLDTVHEVPTAFENQAYDMELAASSGNGIAPVHRCSDVTAPPITPGSENGVVNPTYFYELAHGDCGTSTNTTDSST